MLQIEAGNGAPPTERNATRCRLWIVVISDSLNDEGSETDAQGILARCILDTERRRV